MKLVTMVRSNPEILGGPTSCKIQLQDIDALKARGYVQVGEEFEIDDPASDESKVTDGQGKSDVNPDKDSLVAKLLALKESNPKAVKAPPSAIPNMSVKTLLKSIEEAEAAIAAGGQE